MAGTRGEWQADIMTATFHVPSSAFHTVCQKTQWNMPHLIGSYHQKICNMPPRKCNVIITNSSDFSCSFQTQVVLEKVAKMLQVVCGNQLGYFPHLSGSFWQMMMSRNMCSRLGCVLTYTWHFPRPRLSDAIPPSTDVCENKITGGEEKCETVHMVIWHGAVGNMGEMWGNWSMNIVRLQLT